MTQATPNPEKINQPTSFADIQLQLLQRLARGEISQEVYLQAISSLKLNLDSPDFSCY